MPGAIRRRDFLAGALTPSLPAAAQARKRIAALATAYHVRSHADNFITRILEGYWINEKFYQPPCDIVSLYLDQIHPADVGQRLASAYGFPVVKSIEQALTLGTGRLAVDGVLLIAEHGDYPHNEKNQQLYPRFEFFEQVVGVFKKSDRSCPVFVDKHLSYDWKKARRMYEWSRELKFPLMAGSSVSVTFRRPPLDPPLGAGLEWALAVGGGWVADGGIFHNLEAMQAFAERRTGGESGVRAVRLLRGGAVWQAAGRGDWPKELMYAALNCGLKLEAGRPEDVRDPVLCLVEYRDGFRGGALMLGGLVNEYLVAVRVKGSKEPQATNCYVPVENSNNFSPLVHAIVHMFQTGKLLYPVERTLLTTGALAYLMESGFQGQKRLETPDLAIRYRAPRRSYFAPGMGS